jgi:hypothetical protein
MKTYYEEIKEEAKDFIENYDEELRDIIRSNKDESKNYIFDEVIYQQWDLIDKIHEWLDSAWYGFLRRDFCGDCDTELVSAVKILDESNERETDSGLWEGQEPEDAIKTQAFYTARTDLYFEIERQLKVFIEM